MSRDKATYGKISQKYEDWTELQAGRPAPTAAYPAGPYVPEPEPQYEMSRMVFAAIGIGIGAVLLVLSAYTFYIAAQWGDYARDGAQVGYNVVAFFLLIAGIGGIAATWNHNFRVLADKPAAKRQGH